MSEKCRFFKKDNFFLKVDKMDTYHELESQFWAKNSKKCAVQHMVEIVYFEIGHPDNTIV